MSSQYLRALQPSFAGDQPLFAAQDAIAADLIEKAADGGNEAAQEFAAGMNASLARAYVRRGRKRRLLRKARRASMAGHHDLAEWAGQVAAAEETQAMMDEAFAHSCVRGTHDAYGYFSDIEKRILKRQAAEEGMSTQERETVYAQLMDRLYSMAASFGLEEDEFGAGHAAQEAADDMALDKVTTAVETFGGDTHLIFGNEVYEELGAMFEVSQEKLRARRKRLMKRLTKLENKLEEKEESGQKFGIRILQKRIEWLESRLSKLDGKIKKVKKGKRQVKQAEAEAEHVEKAESSAMKETTEEAEEIPVDEVAQIEAELEEVQEDEWGAEVDLYGMSERRKARILRRLQRLEVRLDKMEGRKQTAGRQRRITRVRNRIERLRQKLQAPPAETSTTTWGPTSYDPAGEDYISQLTVKDPGSYETSDEWVESFFGTDESVHSADRQPFVAYFARRAEQMGASPEDGFGAEGNDGGFFARIGTFFRTVFVEPVQAFFAPDKRAVRQERRGVRRDKVKAYMDKRRARIDRTQAARKSARQEQRTKQLRRDAGQARRTRRVESRKAARAAHKSAWEAHTPGVQASRRQLALARKNVRQAAQAARRNEQVEQRAVAQGQPPPPPVLLQGTEGWAMYTLDPESNVISYTHPGTGEYANLSGQHLKVQPGTGPHNAIMQAVDFQPVQATA